MPAESRVRLALDPIPDCPEEIGIALAALEDARNRTLRALDGLGADILDWTPSPVANSVGTLLYHIAMIEADWLCSEVLELAAFPDEVAALFPWSVSDEAGRLTVVSGQALATHVDRLVVAREKLLETFRAMSVDDFRRARVLPRYDVTPQWVLHHLTQHEAEHRGEIAAVCAGAASALRAGQKADE